MFTLNALLLLYAILLTVVLIVAVTTKRPR